MSSVLAPEAIIPYGEIQYSDLEAHIDARGVVYVTLNRPQQCNALDQSLILHLTKLFKEMNGDPAVCGVVLAGNGEIFCSGADFHWLKTLRPERHAENLKEVGNFLDMYEAIYNFEKPVVAKVKNKGSYAGGVGANVAVDLCVASDKTVFAAPTLKALSARPSPVAVHTIRKLGARTAEALFNPGHTIGAQDALAFGLVEEICPEDEVDARVEAHVSYGLAHAKEGLLERARAMREKNVTGFIGPLLELSPGMTEMMEQAVLYSDPLKRGEVLEEMGRIFAEDCEQPECLEKITRFFEKSNAAGKSRSR